MENLRRRQVFSNGDGFMIWVVFLCLFFMLCLAYGFGLLDHGQTCTGIMNGDTYLHMDGMGSLFMTVKSR